VIHGLLALPLVLDLSLSSKQQPKQGGAGASASLKDEDPVITATFINDDSPAVKQVSAGAVVAGAFIERSRAFES
jgi:hypothetical protein